ncbi:MAG: response regulator [Candidatus Hydrogenedentes bacterium]|nr:response regulator [Candidatus Hydrogenedentota bacterium]
MANHKNKVFTSGEVAQICGVSPDTVSRWFDLGQLKGYRLGPGGDRRIPFDNLRAFMMNHGIPLDRLEEQERRILVVDDDPYYLDTIPTALTHVGDYKVFTASTGFDAGAMVAEHNPHLLILDIHLSDMDGRMVCTRVRARAETRGTRVLAISGFLGDDEATLLDQFGFDDYLKKPFTLAELTERVEKLLND